MLVHCQVLLDGSFIYLFFNGTYAVFDVPGTSIKKKKKDNWNDVKVWKKPRGLHEHNFYAPLFSYHCVELLKSCAN